MTTEEVNKKRMKLHELKMQIYSAGMKVRACTQNLEDFTSDEIADVNANYESLLKEHDTLLEELNTEGKAGVFEALLFY